MRRGRNPTRRNRKIGTAGQGWRKQSKFVIPERWGDWKPFFQDVRNFATTVRVVHGEGLAFVVEPTRVDRIHACTPDDVSHLLSLLPPECVRGPEPLAGVVMRQPTRKQETLQPVFGRMCYLAEVGPIKGPAIFLDAQPAWMDFGWPRKLSLEEKAEVERMRRIASGYELGRRFHWFDWGLLNLRRWLLYHTLIHEAGHWIDYLANVALPGKDDPDGDHLLAYSERPVSQIEALAHRFSDEWRDELTRRGEIPFARRFDEARLREDGLDPEWFRVPSPEGNEAGPPIGLMFRVRREPLRLDSVGR